MADKRIQSNKSISHLDDYEKVNAAYVQFRLKRNKKDFEDIQIWVYEWIRNFYLNLYLRGDIVLPSDMDSLLTMTYFTFLHKHKKLRKPEVFTIWLYRVCLNASIDHFRRNKTTLCEDNSVLDTAVEFDDLPLKDTDNVSIVRNILNDLKPYLSETKLKILEFKWMNNMPVEKISEVTGLSVQTVKNSYSLSIKKIRQSNKIKNHILKRFVDNE